MAGLPRISASSLRALVLAQSDTTKPTIAVIDVRDEDHVGGHIKGSEHIPSRTLEQAIPSLVHKLKDKEIVIFHCALSQQRGPYAALQYTRARDRLLGGFASSAAGEAMKKNKEEILEGKEKGKGWKGEGEEEEEWEDVPATQPDEIMEKTQKILVLENGFVGWQESYGTDERLTTGYRPEIWKDGYLG